MTEKGVKIPRRVGRPEAAEEIKQQVVEYACSGRKRKEIASEIGIKSVKTITKILHAAGVFLPQGRPRRDTDVRREAPGILHDKRVSVDTAASWAGSAYDNTRLKPEHRPQRELPRSLNKKINPLKIARTTRFD